MNQDRFRHATELRDSGRLEEAISEFEKLKNEASAADETAAVLINVHRCWCELRRFDEAKRTLFEIRKLNVKDDTVCMIIDFGEACMEMQQAMFHRALKMFDDVQNTYADALKKSEFRYLYEDIQQRRVFALTELHRHADSLNILNEATSFLTLSSQDRQRMGLYAAINYTELGYSNDLIRDKLCGVIEQGFRNEIEAQARYRLALLNSKEGFHEQAKYQLEAILQSFDSDLESVPRNFVYEQLAIVCGHLGEHENEKRYSKLARG